ncbi:MAG: SMP-30/gluconolactonase/LRE family protein [Rhodothermia bacterium]|nr:SMP-30/gluconolactonase/LRE family protein [Rhodothermia bacterium]
MSSEHSRQIVDRRPQFSPRLLPVLLLIVVGCIKSGAPDADQHEGVEEEPVGWLEALDPRFNSIVAPDTEVEILAEGFTWAEGPLWIGEGDYLLFSDVPENTVYRWSRQGGLEPWLHPSGNTGFATGAREGSNGLTRDADGRLVLFQHGDRRVARLVAPPSQPAPEFETIVSHHYGRRFNSPNDGVYASSGDIYFTDPPYGLEDSSKTELGFHGVFRFSSDGALSLLTDQLARPNGIALSPDEGTLYVANSDPGRAIWMAYDMTPDGSVGGERLFFDATELTKDRPGLPDGLKVDDSGNIFATGPGGVLVFDPSGVHLGTIRLRVPSANCAFGEAGSALYITAQEYLLRVSLITDA